MKPPLACFEHLKLGDFDAIFFDDSGLTSTCLSRRRWQGISGFGGKKQHNRHGFTGGDV